MAEQTAAKSESQKGSGDLVRDQMNQFVSEDSATLMRLEAEDFNADDLDGLAESISGSGNLNHISVLEQITGDAALDSQEANDISDLTGGDDA